MGINCCGELACAWLLLLQSSLTPVCALGHERLVLHQPRLLRFTYVVGNLYRSRSRQTKFPFLGHFGTASPTLRVSGHTWRFELGRELFASRARPAPPRHHVISARPDLVLWLLEFSSCMAKWMFFQRFSAPCVGMREICKVEQGTLTMVVCTPTSPKTLT